MLFFLFDGCDMLKILPILLIVVGVAVGIGAGLFLRPDYSTATQEPDCQPAPHSAAIGLHQTDASSVPHDSSGKEYVKLSNQFVVPVVLDEVVVSLVLISLSVEVDAGQKETVFAREPKLRDSLLQVMFDHANIGGFKGSFTNSSNLDVLRHALLQSAKGIFGNTISDVLIVDIARQEV